MRSAYKRDGDDAEKTTACPHSIVFLHSAPDIPLKGQINQKIDIFSFVALPSPNTKKNHPKWDLGKDFSSQAFIEKQNIKIRAFPKTSRKRFWNGRVIDWRLRDVMVFQGGKTFCASFCASLIACVRLRRSVRVLTETEWNTRGANVYSLERFFFGFVVVVVVFSSLENYFGFRKTNVRVKTDHQSVSLRRNKTFWTFPKRFVFFW